MPLLKLRCTERFKGQHLGCRLLGCRLLDARRCGTRRPRLNTAFWQSQPTLIPNRRSSPPKFPCQKLSPKACNRTPTVGLGREPYPTHRATLATARPLLSGRSGRSDKFEATLGLKLRNSRSGDFCEDVHHRLDSLGSTIKETR